MSNVLNFVPRDSRTHCAEPDASSVLAGILARIEHIGRMRFETKGDMRQAVALLRLSNVQARQLIGQIVDQDTRSRLIAHAERIAELVDAVGRKVAAL